MALEIKKKVFNKQAILAVLESMRKPNGAFVASYSSEYSALWIRDTLYIAMCYYHLGEYAKALGCVWVIFDVFKLYKSDIRTRVLSPIKVPGGTIHAKYHPETLKKITSDDGWKHHQLDAIGLFLHVVADFSSKHLRVGNASVLRDEEDREILFLLIAYLRSVEYWREKDNGIWEECLVLHSSSLGAVVGGLRYLMRQGLVKELRDSLIRPGEDALSKLLPYESRDDCPDKIGNPDHSHDCDAAELTLIWPYNVIAEESNIDLLLQRIVEGHDTDSGKRHCLLQKMGLQRYWGDAYFKSANGVSAPWPMFLFWLSIICSQRKDTEGAVKWFIRGCDTITPENFIPESCPNGRPNLNTPLAWAHAIALIAFQKLPPEIQKYLLIIS